MSQIMDDVAYLSEEIGGRPAGTKEELEAALYVTERFQVESGFTAGIEEFVASPNGLAVRAVCAVVAAVACIVAMILPVAVVPALLVAIVAAVLYTLEALEKPLISRNLSGTDSQNVVAKYQPNPGADHRRARKIVLVANYDSPAVTPGIVAAAESLPLPLGNICIGACGINAFLLLLRWIFFANAGGMALIIFNIITVLVLLVVLLPLFKAFLTREKAAEYGHAANSNATGVAALLEIARRISHGSLSEADLAEAADEVVIHGEQEAIDEGLVPEGARLVYEAAQLQPPDLELKTPEERLASAKAALAAFTGKPNSTWTATDIAGNLVGSKASLDVPAIADPAEPLATPMDLPAVEVPDISEQIPRVEADVSEQIPRVVPAGEVPGYADGPEEGKSVEVRAATQPHEGSEAVQPDPATGAGEASDSAAGLSVPAPAPEAAASSTDEPSWFVAAQQKAKKSTTAVNRSQRSRYADAIEAAERERAAAQAERERAAREAEQEKLRADVAAAAAAAAQAENGQPAALDASRMEGEAPAQVPSETPAPANPLIPAEDPQAVSEASQPFVDEGPRRRAINLPNIAGTSLPTVHAVGASEVQSPSRSGILRKLRADIPSLSGAIVRDGEERRFTTVRTVGQADTPVSPAPAAALEQESAPAVPAEGTSDPAPVVPAEGTSAPAEPESARVPAANEPRTQVPAANPPASQARVDVPKSRVSGFFNRFMGKGKSADLEESPQEWLNVDESFDPRSVGRERGGWESFRTDDNDDYDDYDDFESENPSGRGWQGGGFSRVRLGGDSRDESPEVSGRIDASESSAGLAAASAPAGTGSVEHDDYGYAASTVLDSLYGTDVEFSPSPEIAELEQIYHFRNPLFNDEVWFVALGSSGDGQEGIRSFVSQHREELRGAMIINIESLGAGTLSVIREEGAFRRTKASSRVKRQIKKVTEVTGIEPREAVINNADSAASVAQRLGMQTMHLAGMEGSRPALKGSADDTIEAIDEQLLLENIDFITELVQRF